MPVDVGETAKNLISVIVALVIGVSLYPVLTSAIESANVTGIQASLLSLLSTIFVIGLVMFGVRALL